ncbi:hypothetical protein EYS09_22200 [Streptomyces kasugaensis]|uniref:Uncharacterized protein n=1 Tax=Streptomyces kasugaensis TaxID=1946 RepID=A0A4Q9HRD6_STRKA|nr:hypothetical protein [Streptomyces kasugaensis]TBO57526.1 hypothetical protein EYS09_22200 [Streptomyces kasugaensis]
MFRRSRSTTPGLDAIREAAALYWESTALSALSIAATLRGDSATADRAADAADRLAEEAAHKARVAGWTD